tara:strand:- start:346 stop:627 length:282 start_codon:yes stop_codon:yes gene_type:complete
MEFFTESQAKACRIKTLQKSITGSDCFWKVNLYDDNNLHYSIGFLLDKDSDKAAIKAKIVSELQGMKKLSAPVSTTSSAIEEGDGLGVGETLA